ncbi:hypothetical protein [Spiroplasma clarkii]|nr:hypothetical protein [Spiroplasma clarkii]
MGYRNILGGYWNKNWYNIFNLIENSKDGGLRTSALLSWHHFITTVLNYKTTISDLLNYTLGENLAARYINDNLADAKTFLDIQYQDFKDQLNSHEYNFSFFYDFLADNAGHLGMTYDSEYVQEVYKYYYFLFDYLFSSYGDDPNTLLLLVTDHGRAVNGKNHNMWDRTAFRSFMVANHNLAEIISRPVVNFVDVKEIVYKFLEV